MSEPKPEYVTETEEALEMLGKGYEPAATIEGPRTVRELTDKGLETFKTWGWIKVSANFIAHIKKLKGAKLAIWQTIALSIDETGKCKLPLRQIEELTGYSHTEVIESIQELQEMGYLGVDKTKKTNIYTPEFAARGAGNDPSNGKETLVKKLESTPAYQNESSPSEENSTPSISRVKRVNANNLKGVEAAMFLDRPVTEADLPNSMESQALQAFERDMQLPASWEWYPAKQTKEREWRVLREFVIKTYAADPKAFEKYNTWRNQPFVKGAKSNTQIKDYPADFEVSWSDYLRANLAELKQTVEVTYDKDGAPESW